ncbi:MAG TPA: hypothetical protein VFD83_01070 [Candidatus Polarisedimenticolia bacterium]|nr:hypothetical protein [Candidatus Polarisedimenticolia bacterium]
MEAQVASLASELDTQNEELASLAGQERAAKEQLDRDRAGMTKSRGSWNQK